MLLQQELQLLELELLELLELELRQVQLLELELPFAERRHSLQRQ